MTDGPSGRSLDAAHGQAVGTVNRALLTRSRGSPNESASSDNRSVNLPAWYTWPKSTTHSLPFIAFKATHCLFGSRGHCFFLADIDKELRGETLASRQSIKQLRNMLDAISRITDRPELGIARPEYDKVNLVLAITAATQAFHRRWRGVLGLSYEADVDKAHWARVKALNRRFAEGTADQYDTLRPVSDLREKLKDEIYRTVASPRGWTGGAGRMRTSRRRLSTSSPRPSSATYLSL